MEELKKKIYKTIYMPDFLRAWKCDTESKDIATAITFEILACYYKAIQPQLMTMIRVRNLCKKIDDLSYDFSQISNSDIYLQNWLFIGQTVESWLEYAVEEEEYEVAANLRKLLNNEYA